MNRRAIWLVLSFLIVSTPIANAKPLDLPLLNRSGLSQQNPFFQEVQEHRDNKRAVEQAKIMYLIQQIRNSPYHFVRNGKKHEAPEAAKHLMRKYYAVKSRIDTAKEFITSIASRSESSGVPYMVEFEDGRKYPSRDVLNHELKLFESYLLTQKSA